MSNNTVTNNEGENQIANKDNSASDFDTSNQTSRSDSPSSESDVDADSDADSDSDSDADSDSDSDADSDSAIEENVIETQKSATNDKLSATNDKLSAETLTGSVVKDCNGDYWSNVYLEDGRVYYFNLRTRETSWYPPENISSEYDTNTSTNNYSTYNMAESYNLRYPINQNCVNLNNLENANNIQVIDSSPIPDTCWTKHLCLNGQTYYSNSLTMETTWQLPANLNIIEAKDLDNKQNEEPPEKCVKRPITADPIPGTSWYAVLTGEGKHFYYDHTKQKSTFERPEELENNIILDTILDKYEEQKKMLRATSLPVNPISFKDAVKARLTHHTPYSRGLNPNEEHEVLCEVAHEEKREEEREANQHDANTNEEDNISENNDHDDNINSIKDSDGKKYSYEEKIILFNELLKEKNVSAFSIYEHELSKLQEDYRFHILAPKDRKYLFNEYLKKRVNYEREEKLIAIKKQQEEFISFLRSVVKSSKMSYSDLLIKYSSNPKFRIIKKEKERELLFQKYISELNKNISIETEQLLTDNNKIKNDYFKLLSEINKLDAHTPWRRVKRNICDDERYIVINDSKRREVWFDEYMEKKVEEDKVKDQERMKIEREKASIKERERKVMTERKHLEETRSRERGTYLHESAVVEFCSLLTDAIHNPKLSWHEARTILKQDLRWNSVNNLSRDDYLNLFDKHIDKLYQKLKQQYYKLLKDKGVKLDSNWEDIYPLIKDDIPNIKFSSNERRLKKEFKNYQNESISKAIENLHSLLIETKMIDNKFLAKSKLIPSLYDEVIDILKKDNRFNILDFMDSQRKQIIDSYIEEIEKKGAPPPPTASIPLNRFNK